MDTKKTPEGSTAPTETKRERRSHSSTGPAGHWWSSSASSVIWDGSGKTKKIAVCYDAAVASQICRLQWAEIKRQNTTHQS